MIYKRGERANIEEGLETVRGTVEAGSFIPDQYPKIYLISAHQQAVGARSPCKKRSCGCKGGKCGADVGASRLGWHATTVVAHVMVYVKRIQKPLFRRKCL